MKLIKSTLYLVKIYGTWEDSIYIKADSIEEVIAICREYIKGKYGKDAPKYKILEINMLSSQVIESSTKTVTIDV